MGCYLDDLGREADALQNGKQPHSRLSPQVRSSAPMEGMLNPLWPGLEPRWRVSQLRILYHRATSAGCKPFWFLRYALRSRTKLGGTIWSF
ncbi:unnamed protein product [Microthlaspi erraticum]|uniref:Uncharacterized protein n=1 Tax=Microthlaspi erraticum TaxID=1685480 RepID=A0A6D2IGS9_9BRAS|nr:unnamed protein product [Microthlaspi erraticum]